jgi:hypothetical protein
LILQLRAEKASVLEEKTLLQRYKHSTELLTELSGKVHGVTAAALDREERFVRHLDQDLVQREARCVHVCLYRSA